MLANTSTLRPPTWRAVYHAVLLGNPTTVATLLDSGRAIGSPFGTMKKAEQLADTATRTGRQEREEGQSAQGGWLREAMIGIQGWAVGRV